ncbi:MAG TPA: YciI family protein, partial [Flavipsychrobacter sp.]|nr:YciI family protein [Flavipsychrobacter sp.]
IISGKPGSLKDGPYNETKEVIAGYFLIQAANLDEAMQIAKENPVFEDGTGARIEVRPIKIMEGING